MSEIFISYKSERRKAAEHFSAILKLYGYDSWFDYSLIKGADFGRQLDAQIRKGKVLIVLWCTRSVQSEWVQEEVDLAIELGTLLPIKIEPCSLPVGNRRKDYLDLSDWDGSPRSHLLDPMLMAISERVGRYPQQDFRAMLTYEQQWRRFGAPSLRAFALNETIESTRSRLFPNPDPAKEQVPTIKIESTAVSSMESPPSPAEQTIASASEIDRENTIPVGVGNLLQSTIRRLIPGNGKFEWFRDGDGGPEMVVLPLSTFRMGNNRIKRGLIDCDMPARTVTIRSPFAVSRAPITFSQWDYAIENGLDAEDLSDEGWGRGDRPVINVTWNDAKAYVEWLRDRTGHFYRLLSEAEWEYACRAGTTSNYWWGDMIDESNANYASSQAAQDKKMTRPVYDFQPNPFGLYQVHGNVWEWVEDQWHENFSRAPVDGSPWCDKLDGKWRVVRGGGWESGVQQLRSSARAFAMSDVGYPWISFRIARSIA